MKRDRLALVLLVALGLAGARPAATAQLANGKLRLTFSQTGQLESVENRLAQESYGFVTDAFELETDRGRFSNRSTAPTAVTADPNRLVYRFDFAPADLPGSGVIRVDLTCTLEGDQGFFRRALTITTPTRLKLRTLRFGKTTFATPARETLHYVTFIAAPTVEFVRSERGGFFTGIENPFFTADLDEGGVALGFAPGLILKAGESYTSEPQFLGVYRRSGVRVEDSGREFRYNANGSGYKPIDRNEMRAMRAFALDYLRPAQKTFRNTNYQFFHPLPQMPRTDRDLEYFTRTIDAFAAIGGDMIIFKPLHPYRKPDADKPLWDVLPDDPNHVARQVADYATRQGIVYGFYMGCAAHGAEGNAGGLSFRPDQPEWKKRDAAGRRAPDNCLACDDYFEWWFTVQNNTIRKYGLRNWSWDPSLGSGMNCHDESHGHLADQGAYKGWRRCLELMERLKAANPGLFIQGFYGTKNFGLWGLRHVDQHEVYNEQTIIVSTRHHQISDDRQNADGLRFQNNWSMRFRFTPAVIGHALAHRISEGGFDPDLIKAWDYQGWQYSVMSSLAVAGSVMPTLLPYETDVVPGYVAFYRKWLRWAKDHFDSVNQTEPFGEQVQPGSVDGYARIQGDHGFVFLFNGNPRPAEITFEIGDEINLQDEGRYQLTEIYPAEPSRRVLDANGRSVFARGQTARITVPANACFLFELAKVNESDSPLLIGAAGAVARRDDTLAITGLVGRPGHRLPLRVRLPHPDTVQIVTANGVAQKFSAAGNEIVLEVQFAGERWVRELDAWTQANGEPFSFPGHASTSSLRLTTRFTLSRDVPQRLEQAKPRNFAEMGARIAEWQKPERRRQASYSYHNFICERPERLWLILPLLHQTDLQVTVNHQPLPSINWDPPSASAFVDVTELVHYGAENQLELALGKLERNAFMGPFLLYPDETTTDRVLREPTRADAPVVYRQPLVSAPPTRYRKGAGPRVMDARMLGHVTLTEAAELRVTLDLPPEQIRRVLFFESGFTWMGQHPLTYTPASRCWTARVTPGNRASLQESADLWVWAEGTNGLRSEYQPVKVGWDFVAGPSPNRETP